MILPKLQKSWHDIERKSPRKSDDAPSHLKGEEKKTDWKRVKSTVVPLLKIITVYGFILNFTCTVLFKTKFTLLSWLGYGIAYYFITDEFPIWIRKIIGR